MGIKEWIKEDEAAVVTWNTKYPVGTEVRVMRDSGGAVTTTTASEAFMLSGHTAVIHLNGISGCYALDRCRPTQEVEAR